MLSSTAVYLIISLGVIFYFYISYIYSYWRRRGVKSLKPTFPFGNYEKLFRQKLSIGEQLQVFYRSTNDPFIGVYGAIRPTLILRDPELIRTILIKDFQYFIDRGVYYDETMKKDPLSAHLFAISTDKWKNWRVKLTPTFTSGKLKAMFSTIVDCTVPLHKFMEKAVEGDGLIEAREMTACYTTNVIASVAFGLDIDSFEHPNTGFRKFGRKFFSPSLKNGMRFSAMFVCPKLLKWFNVRIVDQDITDFMIDAVKQNLELREKHKIVRKDFFQLLVQLRNRGDVQKDDEWDTEITNDEKSKKLTIEDMTAQAFVFFVAGFETSSSTMSFLFYELAKQPHIQHRVQAEIDDVLRKYDGHITYEALTEMKYLESCIDETLRKYPSLPLLNREVTKEYQIPGTDIILEKGTSVKVPMYALHHDEKYFPNPEEFDPDRFSEENKANKSFNEMPYFPFGDGPRNCIGLRLGKLQSKVGIASVLKDFCFTLADSHIGTEIKFSPCLPALSPIGGINLHIKKR